MSIKDGKEGAFNPIGPIPEKLLHEVKEELLQESQRRDTLAEGYKETNPKDAIGVTKAPLSTVPAAVMLELGVAMLEGSCKYGRHNYRVSGVRASVYYDALMRHVMDWWEGNDIDPDSGLNHTIKGIATLTVLRDAMLNGMVVDDRPVAMTCPTWLLELNARTKAIIEKYPNPKKPFLAKDYPREEIL